jgi:uncharacterized Zn-finger protein
MFLCDKCNKEFNTKGNYERHLNSKNPCELRGMSKIYKCEICHKEYDTKNALTKHLNGL